MINKIYFGKKLSFLRRKSGLTQTALADMLSVTSQAVSKWECGASIPDIEILLEISRIYGVSVNELFEDEDFVFTLSGIKRATDKITYFSSDIEMPYNKEWAESIKSGRWIEKNWESAQNDVKIYDSIGENISSRGGTVLEIGAGPGGGFMPYILKANPDSTVIVSDLSPTVVREWKKYLDENFQSPSIYYCVTDFCNMPFYSDSIDTISDGGGIGNCEQGSKAKALKEAYRVLKPGGLLVTSTGFVNKETLASLPSDVQETLKLKRPDIFEDLYEETVLAGFSKIDSIICGEWYTDDDDSTVASLARELGVNLKFTGYVRFCYK